jgi:hypothetical protein
MDNSKPTVYVKLDCGQHYGVRKPGESLACVKCGHFAATYNPKYYQANGTPYAALIGEIVNPAR